MEKVLILLIVILTGITLNKEDKVKVLFFGDSITQAGVLQGGYINVLERLAQEEGYDHKIELVGKGIGGNKVYDLFFRLEKDVLAEKPDIVLIYVGINDIWHKTLFRTGTDPDKFEVFYQHIIDKIKEQGTTVILCTPGLIGERTDNQNPQDEDLNEYSAIIKNLSEKNNLELCDLRAAMQEYNVKNNPSNKSSGILTYDGVHLTKEGNQLVAENIWFVLKKYLE